MYDIDLYTYKDRPIIDEDSVKIYPLNDQGMTKYLLQKESHVCTYLDKIKQNPSILNDFTSHNNGNSEPFNSPQIIPPIEVNVKEPKINDKPVISSKIHPQSNRNAKVNLYKKSMLSNSMDRLSKKQNDYYNQLFYSKKPDLSENTNTYFENVQRSILTSRKKNLEKYASLNNNNNKQQRKYENVQSPSHLKLNKYFKSCHKKMTFEDIFGYPYPLNEKSRGNVYNNEISFLKEEMNCVENANTNMNNNNHNTRNGKKLRYSNSFISFAKGLNRSMNIKEESINRLDTKDNLKLKNINCEMKNKLQQQTNQEFLMKNKLPDIRLIANGSDVVRKIRNGLCKQLGEKYDPFAYVIEKPQIKGRNYYGEKKCKECLLKNINSYVKKSTKYQPEFNPNPKINDIKKLPKNNIHIPSLELINIITSFSLLSKLSIHSYYSTLISPKIGTTNEDMVIQLTSLSSALLNDKKPIKKELIYKRPLVKQNSIDNYKHSNYNNISDNNGNLKTLDNISINTNILNRTIDSSLYKYQLSAQKNYDEKSLAEFLNDEIKNIKQSQSINNNNSTIITQKKRPSTPNNTSSNLHKQMTKEPSILLDFNKEDYINFNSNNNNKINILKNKNFNNKKQSHVHLNTYNNNNSKSNSYFNSKTNTITNNNRTTYCSFRTGNIKQQSNKNIIKARKQDPLIPLKKQKEIANVQTYDHSKYDSKLNNKINIKTQNHSSSNSFYISSFTPRKEYTRSFISERTRSVKTMKKIGSVNKSTGNINKNVVSKKVNNKKEGTDKAKNVNCNGNKVNITIDIRDLMKDDYEDRLLKKSFQQFDEVSLVNNEIDIENSNEVGNEILVANGRDSLDNLIITQK